MTAPSGVTRARGDRVRGVLIAGDVVLAVSMAVLGLVRDSPRLGGDLGPPDPRPFLVTVPPWAVVAAHLAGGGLLLARRRHPGRVAVSLAVLSVVVPVPAALAMTYSVGRYGGRLPVVLLLTAGLVTGLLVGGDLVGLLGVLDWARGDPYSIVLGAALLTVAGLYMRTRSDLDAAVAAELRRVAEERDLVAELDRLRERAALAVELHDAVARWLTLMTLGAATLESAGDPAVRRTAGELTRHGARAVAELHGLIGALTDGSAGTADERRNVDIHDDGRPVTAGSPAGIGHGVLSPGSVVPGTDQVGGGVSAALVEAVVVEALVNAGKHAAGAPVRMQAQWAAARVDLTVDSGPARAAAPALAGSGVGLRSLRDRCAAVGGELQWGPTPDGGFRVTATLPAGSGPAAGRRDVADEPRRTRRGRSR